MWALTATWPAEEMVRPGSVWSHTLLVDWGTVCALKGAAGFLSALRRPDGPGDLAQYRKPVRIEDSHLEPAPGAEKLVETLLIALYAWPDQPAAVVVGRLQEAESALLAVWEQQWPRLRLETTFATRTRVAPDQETTVHIATRRARGRPMMAIDADGPLSEPQPTWLRPLLDDVYRPGDLRTFLRRYGPDVPQGRGDMTRLVQLQRHLSTPEYSSDDFEPVTEHYRLPAQMDRLKREALERDGRAWAVPESLRVLTTLRFYKNVQWQSLALGQRLADLWPESGLVVVEALCLGWKAAEPALAGELLDAIADKADGRLLAALAAKEVSIAVELAHRRPTLLQESSLWRLTADWHTPVLEALAGRFDPDPAIADALVEADNYDLAAQARELGVAPGGALAAAIAREGFSLTALRRYKQVFAGATSEAFELASRKDADWVERAMASLLGSSARNPVVRNHAVQLAEHLHELDPQSQQELAAKLFTSNRTGAARRRVMQSTFPILHRALEDKTLPAAHRRQLEQSLPADKGGDSAACLRKALLRSIKKDSWSEQEIVGVLRRAGSAAERLRPLTDKKSELRKVLDAARDALTF